MTDNYANQYDAPRGMRRYFTGIGESAVLEQEYRTPDPPNISAKRPPMLWVSAITLLLAMTWEVLPISVSLSDALSDGKQLAALSTPFNIVILVWMVIGLVVSLVMAIGLIARTEWAWLGSIISVHGIYAPPLTVLVALFMFCLVTTPAHRSDVKYLMADYLLRLIIPYLLTYILLLFCLTRTSVKQALAVNE